MTMVSTVKENESFHTKREIERAREARRLYHAIGTPTIKNYKNIIRSNMIKNCPVTEQDIDLAEEIYGPDVSYLKGKTVRTKPTIVKNDSIQLPKEITERDIEVTLYVDTIFVNGIPFMATIGYPMYYRTCDRVEDKKADTYYEAIDKVLRVYNKGGYRVKTIECDEEYRPLFEKIEDELGIEMNYANPQDHVPQAERNNRTIKECVRTGIQRTPYATIPKVMIQALVETSASKLNMFPAKHGMSQYYSPEAIVTQRGLDYDKHCKCIFGEYVIATHQNNPTNVMRERGIDAIYLRPNDNRQGGHIVMNLNTGQVITRGKVTPVPMTNEVKKKVEQMAIQQGITAVKFTNDRGVELPNVDWIAGVDYDADMYEEIEDMDEEDYVPGE